MVSKLARISIEQALAAKSDQYSDRLARLGLAYAALGHADESDEEIAQYRRIARELDTAIQALHKIAAELGLDTN